MKYVTTRVAGGVLTLFIVSFLVFGVINLVPGDVVAVLTGDQGYTPEDAIKIKHELGMDKPIPERYVRWLGDISRGDFGESIKDGREVTEIIQKGFQTTVELALLAVVLTVIIGIPLGVWSAVRQDKIDDYILRTISIGFLSIPTFVIGTLIIVLPAKYWGWTPPLFFEYFMDDPVQNLSMLIIPAAILASHTSAVVMRITRSAVLEVLREDYVRTARAKGLTERVVLTRHALKNAMLPVITTLGGQFAFLMGGAVVVEVIFNVPGIGQTMVTAIHNRDFPVITGVNLVIATIVVVTNLGIDLSYKVLDPRVTY